MNTSKVSVIITAHNRKRYILDAIRSVIISDFPKDKLEIIIVKNYKDDYVDSEIERLSKLYNVISVVETDTKLGKKISSGIEHSQGDIITFLEDDDLYLPSRLKTITQVFDSNSSLIFYHNMIEIVGNKKIDEFVTDYLHDKIISCDDDKIKNWKSLARTEAKFNISSMAIRRESMTPWIDVISKINFAVDNFLFYVALKEKGCIMIDSEVLTKYRITDKREYVENENELLDFIRYVALKYYEDFSLFANIFPDIPFNEGIKQGLLFWYLKYKFLSNENKLSASLQMEKFLNILIKNKILLGLYLLSFLPFKVRERLIPRLLGIK